MVLIIDGQTSGLAGNMFIGAFIDLGANKDDIIKWKKFLLAKGCCCLLKDNQYITTETE